MDLTCAVEQRADATVVHVSGELDIASAAQLRTVLIDVLATSPATHLVVDLEGVSFIDSTGIGVVVGAHRRVTANGGSFSAVVTTPVVRKVLQTTGLLQAWRVTASVPEAMGEA
jgi:anti-sigma B factor antagonist